MHKTTAQFATITENGVVKQIGRSLIEQPIVKSNTRKHRGRKSK